MERDYLHTSNLWTSLDYLVGDGDTPILRLLHFYQSKNEYESIERAPRDFCRALSKISQGSSHHGRLHYLSLWYPGWYLSVSKDLISIYSSNRVDQTMLSSKCHIAKSLSNFCCHGAWGRRSYVIPSNKNLTNTFSVISLTSIAICQYLLKYYIPTLALPSQPSWVVWESAWRMHHTPVSKRTTKYSLN